MDVSASVRSNWAEAVEMCEEQIRIIDEHIENYWQDKGNYDKEFIEELKVQRKVYQNILGILG